MSGATFLSSLVPYPCTHRCDTTVPVQSTSLRLPSTDLPREVSSNIRRLLPRWSGVGEVRPWEDLWFQLYREQRAESQCRSQ
jgi:hypothetical protein